MWISDTSVKRPVLAAVLSLLIVVLGLMSYDRLPVREIPNIDPPVVSISTSYPGASAAVVESRITQIIEDAVAGIAGIETISSSSSNGRSGVNIQFTLDREIESATNDVRDAVSRAVGRLPPDADPPQVEKQDADADPIMWLNFSSDRMNELEVTDYADRFLVDRLQVLPGVARVNFGGALRYAMRIWIDRQQLAARNLTVADVINALRRENVELPAGRVESATRDFTVRVPRSYNEAEDFAQIVLGKGEDGHIIQLGEVARVELAAAEKRTHFRGNGLPQIGMGVIMQSTANQVEVARAVREEVDRIQPTLPEGMQLVVAVDNSEFIETSIKEVWFTMVMTALLVLGVIYLFLGSWRAALIPAVTIPICVVSSFMFLALFGFSINLLTLLALVLSIGLVVDDAIVVLENCQRRIDEEGETALLAAYRGARQVGFAVIATTAVLVAVFVPIAFAEGNVGRLFRELGMAIAAAVFVSSIVALSLSPMMCSKLLVPSNRHRGLSLAIDHATQRMTSGYRSLLGRTIDQPLLFGAMMIAACAAIVGLYRILPNELAPAEDRGVFFMPIRGPEGAGFDYTRRNLEEVETRLLKLVDEGILARVNTRAPAGFGGGGTEEMHTGQAIVVMRPWTERKVSTEDAMRMVQGAVADMPGLVATPVMRQGLSRGFGQPLQIVLLGTDYPEIAKWRDEILLRMAQNPRLINPDSDYRETRPQLRVEIDRARASDLGVSVDDIGSSLDAMLSGRRVSTFVRGGEEYDVIIQAERQDRSSPTDLDNVYVRARTGELIPLGNLVTLSEIAEPGSFNRFNRLRAITISARPAPGYPLGEALADVEAITAEVLPAGAQIDYRGDSRELKQSGNTLLFTFGLALLVVFLVLAAQFESFIHPFVIMLTVPLAVLGALIGLWAWGSSLNLFSQIGIVMLVGLAAKNGVLIVEFANQLRDEGRSIRDAVIEASAIRLRPILMTSLSTVIGALPLLLFHGPGENARQTIGVTIVFGVMLSTVLSLFVVPALYQLLARYTRSPEALAREIDALDQAQPQQPHATPIARTDPA
jgi:multidrug efflux pump